MIYFFYFLYKNLGSLKSVISNKSTKRSSSEEEKAEKELIEEEAEFIKTEEKITG